MKRIKNNIPTVAENEHVKIKIYEEDGGEQHVHFIDDEGNDCKISLLNFRVLRNWGFDRVTLKNFVYWVYENQTYLHRKWRQMRRRNYAKQK